MQLLTTVSQLVLAARPYSRQERLSRDSACMQKLLSHDAAGRDGFLSFPVSVDISRLQSARGDGQEVSTSPHVSIGFGQLSDSK